MSRALGSRAPCGLSAREWDQHVLKWHPRLMLSMAVRRSSRWHQLVLDEFKQARGQALSTLIAEDHQPLCALACWLRGIGVSVCSMIRFVLGHIDEAFREVPARDPHPGNWVRRCDLEGVSSKAVRGREDGRADSVITPPSIGASTSSKQLGYNDGASGLAGLTSKSNSPSFSATGQRGVGLEARWNRGVIPARVDQKRRSATRGVVVA